MCKFGKMFTAVQSWISGGLKKAFLGAILLGQEAPANLAALSVVGGLAAWASPWSLLEMHNHGSTQSYCIKNLILTRSSGDFHRHMDV